MIYTKKILLFTSLILLFNLISKTQAVQILESKVIIQQVTDCDMHFGKIIFDNNDNVLVSMKGLFYANGRITRTDNMEQYCCNILGSFVKDNRFYAAIYDINTVDIYSTQKKFELVSKIKAVSVSGYPYYDGIVAVPEQNNSYYLFGHYLILPLNPVEWGKMVLSAGHGVTYEKPFLAEVKNSKIIRNIKLDYGGKRDESYAVQEVRAGKDSIHFFGFRNVDVPFIGNRGPIQLVRFGEDGYGDKYSNFRTGNYYEDRDITQSIILYYSDYNLKKGKNTRNCKIYENTPGYDKKTDTYSDYGVLSADSQDDDVFAVFSWVEVKHFKQGSRFRQEFNINNINSSIYYWQCSDKSYSKVEKIAEGFCPLVRVDQFGFIHVFWVDRSGNIVQKTRKDNKWSNEEIILNGFNTKSAIIYTKRCSIKTSKDRPEAILYTKFFAAEFDKDNNLHMVYPTAEGIVYTKLKLE